MGVWGGRGFDTRLSAFRMLSSGDTAVPISVLLGTAMLVIALPLMVIRLVSVVSGLPPGDSLDRMERHTTNGAS